VIAHGRFIDSSEYRSWKTAAIFLIKKQIPKGFVKFDPTFEDQLFYIMRVFLPDLRSDAANYDKGVRDVLTHAGVWKDDKFCMPRFEAVRIDKANPRVEVWIGPRTMEEFVSL